MTGRPPFPFIVGCGRSGTTLLRLMLEGHPDLAIPPETNFAIRPPADAIRDGGAVDAGRVLDGFERQEWFARWRLDPGRVARLRAAGRLPYPDLLRRAYAEYADQQGKSRHGNKSPWHVDWMPALLALIPEARFIHLIRDGRDVVLSMLETDVGPDRVRRAAHYWRGHVEGGIRAGRALPAGTYVEVRYEDLVEDPDRVLRNLCPFIGLGFDEAMLHPERRSERILEVIPDPSKHRSLRLPPTTGLRDWRRDMTEEDLAIVDGIAGALLETLGYERERGAPVSAASLPRLSAAISVRRSFAVGTARRAVARARLRATATVDAAAPERPVFVVGCPRSGTSMLYTLLAQHPDLASTGEEGHVLWDAYQHPAKKGWGSDRATADDVHDDERGFLYGAIRRIAGSRRFLDKTPKSSLRIPYLDRLFPDATFVFLHRDGRATVSSLIEGWSLRRGIAYRLPVRLELEEYRGRYWSYLLPPGWRHRIRGSIADVAAFQYRAANEHALRDLAPLESSRLIRVAYEDLIRDPASVTSLLLDGLELHRSAGVERFAARIHERPIGSLTPPHPGKWRARGDQIERVLPRIAPTMQALGYDVHGAPR